jgi:diphthamide synthase subunit DPH2
MKILVCCSKHFYKDIEEVKSFLESRGHEISLPNSYNEPFAEERFKKMSNEEHAEWKGVMMRRDEPNIKIQDAILFLNFEKNKIPNYIGGATFLEIYTAWEMNKKIFFYNPLPNCSFIDELKAINPIIINGDLEVIR